MIVGSARDNWCMDDPLPLGLAMAEAFAVEDVFERMPVGNREERAPIDEVARTLVFRRDRGMCWICGTWAVDPVLDHVRPRSNWPADQLALADRTDNLHVACWDCNEERSNRTYLAAPSPAPVVLRCYKCEYQSGLLVGRGIRVYCARCGYSESGDESTFL